jgi:hypothetical protein
MRKGLIGLLAGVGIALIVGALVIGIAAAQTSAGPWSMHGAVWTRAAAILGVPEARLAEAFTQAHDQALDDAVKAGQLTQAQADWMKQRHQWMLQNGGGPGMMGGYGMMVGRGMMGGRFGGGLGPGAGASSAIATPTR